MFVIQIPIVNLFNNVAIKTSLSCSSQSHPSYAASLPGASTIDRRQKTSPTPSLSYDPIHLSNSSQKLTSLKKSSKMDNDDTDTDLDIYSRSSIDVDESEERYQSANSSLNIVSNSSMSSLTPIRNVEIGALIPFTPNGEQRNDIQVNSCLIKM